MIIGLYQRYNDQIGQTAQFVREIPGLVRILFTPDFEMRLYS